MSHGDGPEAEPANPKHRGACGTAGRKQGTVHSVPDTAAQRAGRARRRREHAGRYQRTQARGDEPEDSAQGAEPSGQEQHADAARSSLFCPARDAANAQAGAVLAGATQRVAAMAAAQQVLYEEHQPTSFQARDFPRFGVLIDEQRVRRRHSDRNQRSGRRPLERCRNAAGAHSE